MQVSQPPSSTGSGEHLLRLIAGVASLYSIGGGVLTLAGWGTGTRWLTDWSGVGISMFPNAAVCAIAFGSALLINLSEAKTAFKRSAIRFLSSVCGAIGGLTLLQHTVGWNFGIDEMIFKGTWGQAVSMAPMRIGVPASTSFLVLGLGLLVSTFGDRARRWGSIAGLVGLGIASLALTGYWFGADRLFGIARYTGIAWQTASIVAALSLGLMASIPEWGLVSLLQKNDAGGAVARKLLLPLIGIPLLLGWLRLRGEEAGLFDQAFGTAIRSLVEIVLFLGLLWWAAKSISQQSDAVKTAQRAFLTMEERFARFMQSLPGLAWIKDIDGRYIFANEAFEKEVGHASHSLYGLTDEDLFPPATAAQFLENDRRAIASSGLQIVETVERGGVSHSLLVNKFPIYGPDGTHLMVGGIAIDITDRIRAEESLREADRRKDEFLATLAHELRNPLAPIRMAAQFCKTKNAGDAELTRTFDIIDRQVQQMVRLLDDLLDASRISYNKLELRMERVELSKVLQHACESSRPLLDGKDHTLEMILPEEPVPLQADPVRLAQVFCNLLNNAAKFTNQRGHIVLRADRSQQEVVVSVRDNGSGIPPQMLSSIFRMFSQGEISGHSHEGLGIGLALAKGLVELHGGRVEVRSEGVDKGSEFLVYLPIPKELASLEIPTGGSAVPAESVIPRNILVADDLSDSADSMAVFLRTMGHHVSTAYSGKEAISAAERSRPDIILLDVGMPKVDGHEVCRAIRRTAWGKDVLIIAITGWGQELDRQRTKQAGFNHHLVKPVDPGELTKILAGWRKSC